MNAQTGVVSGVLEAKQEARSLREAISKLSKVEKLAGAKYLEPVERLLAAVENI